MMNVVSPPVAIDAISGRMWDYADTLPFVGGPVPLEPYRSTAFFELERERIFRRAWLVAGRADEVPKPGDYVVKEFEIVNTSVIFVHGKDGVVRAFYNVCPHRGNQVVRDTKGSASAFVCSYHAWTFSNDGSLRGVPDQAMFRDFEKSSCGLSQVSFETWNGWMFINFDKTPEVTLREYLGTFGEALDGLENINDGGTILIQSHLKCNWKVASDAFLEGYHIQAIHPTTLKTMYSPDENRYGRPVTLRGFGSHSLNSMYGNPAHQPNDNQPVEQFAYDLTKFDPEYLQAMGRFATHAAVNPTRSRTWSMDKYHVFPNTHIDIGPNGFWMHQFWPINVRETRHEARFYTRAPKTLRQRFTSEYAFAHAADVVLEDLSNVDRTQKGIDTGGTDSMILSDSEVLIRHSVNNVLKWTRAETVAEALKDERA